MFPAVGPAQPRAVRKGPGGADTAFLGILMLETRFPRPPGDIGHPDSFPVPTRQRVVGGATAVKVVRDAAGLAASGLVDDFVAAARRLESEGALAITTSCGFLVLFQRELQDAVGVPLVTSSLVLLPALLAAQRQVGVLTISAASLGPQHLAAAGVPGDRAGDVIIEGMDPDGEFVGAILGDRPHMDAERAASEAVAAALSLKRRAPQLRTLVLECTNLPPFAAQIELATGLRTLSLLQCETLLRPFGRNP
ncbi:MAG TPA: aspartate/glutamate racemase family protein [Ramlibacter sp.]|nr:aspartate/glutamate racemase family protein [Ramlibacter sp.]